MPRKSWHIERRTFLKGVGVTLALPWLEGMSWSNDRGSAVTPPNRFCAVYFPFGIADLAENDERAQFGWWPLGEGREYRFSKTLEPLAPFRDQITPLAGLDHPAGYELGGHGTAGIFLTGGLRNNTRTLNRVSADQVVAEHLGRETRFPSLVCSTEGGVGALLNSNTLSYDRSGNPLPGVAEPSALFDMLFGAAKARQTLRTQASVLDQLLQSTRELNGQLGTADRRKLDEYLVSVRSVEQEIGRSRGWLDKPSARVDAAKLNLACNIKNDPRAYLRVVYDLLFLAFQTDSTRVATFLTGNMRGESQYSAAAAWPKAVGVRDEAHKVKHDAGSKPEDASKYDAFLLEQFAYFMNRLQGAREGDATLLDRTVLLYGSSNSTSHANTNYPLILAGGRSMGFKHGQYLKFPAKRVPMSNLLLTAIQGLGVRAESFADSTGALASLRA